jgi:NarL family two-component system sensor histidine kinase LiaS
MGFVMKIAHLPEDMKIIYVYRYVSLLTTSIFYVFGNNASDALIKVFMIVCLTVSSIIFNYIYGITGHSKMRILYIIIEVMGSILILIPTGGINSPYIWYSLNSILVTVYFYNIYISFLVLLSYQVLSFFLSQIIFHNNNSGIFQLLTNNSNLLLSFILITITAQLLLNQAKKLNIKSKDLSTLNNQMSVANTRLNDSIEQIMNMYQAVHTFVNLDNKDRLINLLIKYTKEITKSPVILFSTPVKDNIWITKSSNYVPGNIEETITECIKNNWNEIKNAVAPLSLIVNSRKFIVISVNSSTKFYGILGVELTQYEVDPIYKQTVEQLTFLASLSSIALERFDLEEFKKQLLVNEEQNRIANELHDSVSQRLFALSCGVFGIMRKTTNTVSTEVALELSDINSSINTTIRELREVIYGKSWNKYGVSVFQMNVKKYLNDISKLYDINISFSMDGNEGTISSILKNALYRIICEGVGNSARHGESENIRVSLILDTKKIKLIIVDDGTGLKFNNTYKGNSSGIGMQNMHNLIYSLEGEINMNTKLGCGTEISVYLPNNKINRGEEVII